MTDLTFKDIIVSFSPFLVMAGFFTCIFLFGYFVMIPAQEAEYQQHKAEFDAKSCSDLEKIIHYDLDSKIAGWAKKNYNERCLP